MSDNIIITILEDGTIRTETDRVSLANHQSAENFINEMERMAGGKRTVKSKGGHTHTHQGQTIHHHH